MIQSPLPRSTALHWSYTLLNGTKSKKRVSSNNSKEAIGWSHSTGQLLKQRDFANYIGKKSQTNIKWTKVTHISTKFIQAGVLWSCSLCCKNSLKKSICRCPRDHSHPSVPPMPPKIQHKQRWTDERKHLV